MNLLNKNDCNRNCDNCITLYVQDKIRDEVMKLSRSDDIDGSGCDSGCALELTLTEIGLGFAFLKDKTERYEKALKEIADNLNTEKIHTALHIALEALEGGK